MATKLTLQDLMKINGIDPSDVVVIRHSISDKNVAKCYETGYIHEYTQIQNEKSKALEQSRYWIVFISGSGTQARFFKIYENTGKTPVSECTPSENFPCKEMYSLPGRFVFQLKETDLFNDWENRLVIEWGRATQSWYNKGTTEKNVVSIQSEYVRPFEGYENLVKSFSELEAIINDVSGEYSNYKTALSAVKGVYLILDTKTGKQYVGSAYGADGILGRWKAYVNSPYHGGNEDLIALMEKDRQAYKRFQFCILQIMPTTATAQQVIDVETLYKKKLGTVQFGLNDN